MIVGCICKHPALQINDFKSDFTSPLLLKLQKESSKRIFLLGEFNINLLKYELLLIHLVVTFCYLIYFYPQESLIDNIFSNSTSSEEIESGNITLTFSDHLPQFIFLKDFFLKIPAAKSNILRHNWRTFESNKFISDFDQTDWEQILCSEKSDVNFSMNQYLPKIDSILETHASLKKLNKKELKFSTKSWITQGLQNSIKKKNNIYSKFVKCKNQKLKELYHSNYKTYRNLLSTLLKRVKEKYFTKFFNENIKDIKKTWIGIKSLVSMKHKNNDTPSIIRNDKKYINDPITIANTFNIFFTSIAETVKSKTKV